MSSQYNVFVGISLTNKHLNSEGIVSIGKAAKESFSARRLLFLLADQLEILNLRVYDAGSEKLMASKVEARCTELRRIIEAGVNDTAFPRDIRVSVAYWHDVLTKVYWDDYFALFSLFVTNAEFRQRVHEATNEFVCRRKSTLSPTRRLFINNYVLSEIPVVMRGVTIGGVRYNRMIYPSVGGVGIDSIAEEIASHRFGTVGLTLNCEVKKVTLRPTGADRGPTGTA